VKAFLKNAESRGVEISEQIVGVAAQAAAGGYYRDIALRGNGTVPSARQSTGDPSPQRQERTVTTPAHLRPSAPAVPGAEPGNEKKELRTLTENEKRLARERHQSDEQFLAWLDVPPESVVFSTIGKPEKK
jgi:hypothetical protein